jgi:cation diffusion facilitator family transporter
MPAKKPTGMAGSKNVVIAAMIANGGIAVLKFIGFLLTASPSMLAETYHSISDTGNQVLLLIGIRYSKRADSSAHPFGYGKAQFFYAFLVSVLLFGVAGWESLKHGISKLQGHGHSSGAPEFFGFTLQSPVDVANIYIISAVLIGGIVFEIYAFMKARAELKRQIEEYDWSGYREAFSKSSDITTLTAFIEDTVALLGLFIALVGVNAAHVTGNEAYDAAGAIVIGVLLMLFAVLLAIENKRLILGESLAEDVEADLQKSITDQDGVTSIDDFRSMFMGTGKVLVTADVSFDSGMDTDSIEERITQLEQRLKKVDERVKMVYIEPNA